MILDNRFDLDVLTFSCISAPIENVQADLNVRRFTYKRSDQYSLFL